MTTSFTDITTGAFAKSDGLTLFLSHNAPAMADFINKKNVKLLFTFDGETQAARPCDTSSSFQVDWKYGKNATFEIISPTELRENECHTWRAVTTAPKQQAPSSSAPPPLLNPVQLRRFAQDGFVVLRGAIPLPMLRAAQTSADVKAAAERASSNSNSKNVWTSVGSASDAALVGLLRDTPHLWDSIRRQLFGVEDDDSWESPNECQIAIQPLNKVSDAGENDAATLEHITRIADTHRILQTRHIDGLYAEGNGIPPNEVRVFSLLIGVALSDAASLFSGNFTAFPRSHLQLAEKLSSSKATAAIDSLRTNPQRSVLQAMDDVLPASELHPPEQLCINAGDVYIALPGTVHAVAENRFNAKGARVAVYFRVTVPSRAGGGAAGVDVLMNPLSELKI